MEKEELKKSLLDNLKSRGLVDPVYTDMVNNYMELREIRDKLTNELNEHGVVLAHEKKGLVDNPALQRRVQVSSQMVSVYTSLGFREKATKAKPVEGVDVEL